MQPLVPDILRYSPSSPGSFKYDPNEYDYRWTPEGEVMGFLRRPQNLRFRDESGSSNSYSPVARTYGGGVPQGFTVPKPVPKLTPFEQRQIAQSAVMRGFSTPSRNAPRIASKMSTDVERAMQEQQDLRIRDQIMSELLSLYLTPRYGVSQNEERDFQRRQDILQGLYRT